jgi:cytoskeleton protein RodZ
MADLGEILQNTRLMRGVSLEEAERATHISRRYLQALEAEDFTVFVAAVFARGFLRNYSQYLGLDPAAMLSLWPGEAAVDIPPADVPVAGGTDNGRPRADSESLRTEFERRSRPLRGSDRDRRPSRRTTPATGGDAPGPLSRPRLGVIDPTPASRAAVLAALLLLLMTVVGFGAAKLGGKRGSVSTAGSAPPPTASTAAATAPAGAAKATQAPPARKAGSMPNLVGKDVREAVQQLQQVGITPLVISVPSTKISDPPGGVTRQDPAAGTAITTNSGVTLIVNPAAAGIPAAGGTPGANGQRLPSGSSTTSPPRGTAPSAPTRPATASPP